MPADVAGTASKLVANMERVIIGKRSQLALALAAYFCEGHILLEDVPGVAKTMFARALARSVGCTFKRLQCTPDLLPTDVAVATSQVFRELVIPHLAPFAFGFSRVRKAMFRAVSQTRINYRESTLSAGTAGDVHAGDRLPWAGGGDYDNFAPLAALDWQIHVYGEAGEALRDAARGSGIPLHEFPWTERADDAGLECDALYLVRPDGYIALADVDQDTEALRDHLSRFKIAPRR